MTVTKFKPTVQYTEDDSLFTLMLKVVPFLSDDELKVFGEKFTDAPDFWKKLRVLEEYVIIETGNELVDELNNLTI